MKKAIILEFTGLKRKNPRNLTTFNIPGVGAFTLLIV